jgi:hypothetical protein
LPAGVITSKTFYDMREERTMNIVQVDVGLLRSTGVAPANGVLYVANTSTPGSAVRLVNGAQLPSQGLSVVTENPVYIRGDYNTVAKVPAAVLADAITVLSNNWVANGSDAKGALGTSTRPATATTVNAAFRPGALGGIESRHRQRPARERHPIPRRLEWPEPELPRLYRRPLAQPAGDRIVALLRHGRHQLLHSAYPHLELRHPVQHEPATGHAPRRSDPSRPMDPEVGRT